MKNLKHVLLAAGLGALVVTGATVGPRLYARCAYGTLRAQLRCGTVLTVETSAQKRMLEDGRLAFCGSCAGRPYLLVGTTTDDLWAFPIGDGGRPSFTAQAGNRFTLDCTDRIKTVIVIGDQCQVMDGP